MGPHPVEIEMGLPASEILDVIRRSDRCYQTVRGYVAERHLEKLLEQLKASGAIQDSVFINKDGQPDFRVTPLHGRTKTIECKNVMSKTKYANGDLRVDFQRTRNQLGSGARTGRYYKVTDFDILAACEHNQTGQWRFKFVRTANLPQVTVSGVQCLVKAVRVPPALNGTPWTENLLSLL
jgi:hypothetical protein